MLPHINIPPHRHAHHRQRQNGRRRDTHNLLRLAVRHRDTIAGGRALGVAELLDERAVDGDGLALGFRGEVSVEIGQEGSGPDGGGDGGADSAADGGEHALHGEDDGDVLVRGGGHGGELLGDNEGAAAEGDEDLLFQLLGLFGDGK